MKNTPKFIAILFLIISFASCKKDEIKPDATTNTNTPASYSVGDALQGGIVFSVDATGQHGLIAATTDQGYHISWATANANCNSYTTATSGSGWRLPTKTELELMKTKKTIIGGFLNMNYWSSTKSTDGTSAWTLYMGTTTGGITTTPWKLLSNCTICARAVKEF